MRLIILPLLFSYCIFPTTVAFDLDITSKKSICSGTAIITKGLLDYYIGDDYGGAVGMFVSPYYWWQAGQAFGALVDDWYYCQNDTFEELILAAFDNQRGDNNDYMPKNQTMTEGNDDQGFWGMSVMTACERNFTEIGGDAPDWLALSQAVYNTMWARWDPADCGGGLRWQIFTWNSGYTYKNTIASACLFQMAARLARFTRNETYAEVAETVYEWLVDVEFIENTDDGATVHDGADISENCSDIVQIQWSYNVGVLLGGAAYLFNFTEDSYWLDIVTNLVDGSAAFFEDNVMYERACEGAGTCNNDQRFFKGTLAKNLAIAGVLVPSLYDQIRPLLETSAQAAAQSCSGGSDGVTCGQSWSYDGWDGNYGMGEQTSALEVLDGLLAPLMDAPFTQENDGVSEGDVDAGMGGDTVDLLHNNIGISKGDKASASIITAVVLIILSAGALWVVL